MNKGPLIAQGRTAEVYAWGNDYILKLFHDNWSEEIAKQEARNARLAYNRGISTPAVDEVVEIEGRHGIIYERVDGVSMVESTFNILRKHPWRIGTLMRKFADLHYAIHQCSASDLPTAQAKLERAIQRADPLSTEQKQSVLIKLAQLPNSDRLCHGDMHPENVVITPQGLVVIDWLTAVQGDPSWDVARTSYLLKDSGLPPHMPPLLRRVIQLLRLPAHAIYMRRYREHSQISQQQLTVWQAPLAAARLSEGISEEETQLLELINRAKD